MNVHRNNTAGLCGEVKSGAGGNRTFAGVDLSDWHVWGGRWKDGVVTQYLDGVPTMTQIAPDSFAQPMYLIFNCDRRDGYSGLPAMDLWVDWVRVWQ